MHFLFCFLFCSLALDDKKKNNNNKYRDMLYWRGNDCRLDSVFRDDGDEADGVTVKWAAALGALLEPGHGEEEEDTVRQEASLAVEVLLSRAPVVQYYYCGDRFVLFLFFVTRPNFFSPRSRVE